MTRLTLALLFMIAGPAGGQPDPGELLEAARAACLAVRTASYQARFEEFGERHAAGVTECQVWLARPDGGAFLTPRFRVDGLRSYRDRIEPVPLVAGFDGVRSRRLVASRRQVVERRFDDLAPDEDAWAIAAGELGAGGNGAVLWALVSADPLSLQREEAAEFEGRVAVSGVLCDVIYLPGNESHEGERLFLGVEDHLPRKHERIFVFPSERIGGSILTISDLTLNGDARFEIQVPDEYERVQYERPDYGRDLIDVGAEAPAWTLFDDTGATVALADHRGRVVVLDFWGTWCGPCVRKLPELQQLADLFAGQPVDVLTLSCHEPPNARPRELMTRRGCTLPLLVGAEAICDAYGVAAFPTVYVIGSDGRVVFRGVGSTMNEELAAIIRRCLTSR